MAKKKKGELPSGNIRRQVYDHSELLFDENGQPIMDPKTGKQKKKRVYISITAATKNEADYAKADYKLNKRHQQKPANMTLREAINRYIETSDAVLSPTTVRSYKAILKNGFPGILDIKLSEITNDLLKESVNAESKRMTKGKKPHQISAKTVKNEYGLIATVIKTYAPTVKTNVTLPSVAPNKHELSTPDVIFDLVKGTEIELPVLLAMWLSFTASEIKGLYKSKSISHDGNYISIVQVTVTVGDKQITKGTAKQTTRHRTHRIPPYIKQLIDKVETDQLVTLSASAVSNRFKRLVLKSGIPYMTFHDLRHVNASVMNLLKIPDKYAQERGGWKTDAVMKGTYMQTFSSARVEVDDEIDRYFTDMLFPDQKDDTYYIEILKELSNCKDTSTLLAACKNVLGRNYGTIIEKVQHEMQHK